MDVDDGGTRAVALRWARRVGLLLLAALLVEYVAVRVLVGARESWDSVDTAEPVALVGALVCELASFACFSALTFTLLAGVPRYPTVLTIDLTGNGASKVVPGGGATAAALRFRLLGQAGVRMRDAVGMATLQIAVTTLWLVAALAVGLLAVVPLPGEHPFLRTASVLAVVLLLAFGGLVAVLAARPDQVVRVTHAIAQRLPLVRPDTLEGFVRTLIGQVRLLVEDHRASRRAVLWGLGFWSLDATSLYLSVRAFGYSPNVAAVLVTYALVSLLALLPITPGGLGIVEGVAVPVLVSFGAPYDVALLGVLAWRLFQFWMPIPIAAATYLWLRFTRFGTPPSNVQS